MKQTIKRSSPHVRIGRSSTGLGLFAAKPILRGQCVVEYTGEVVSDDEADKRAGKYLMKIDKKRTIDGSPRTNLARYINHACKPNCVYYLEGGRVRAYALRKIEAGEELTVNYGKEYVEAYIAPYGCRCSAHIT